MKTCPSCNLSLPEKSFYSRKRGDLSGYCKLCHNKIATERITKKRQELKNDAIIFSGGKCQLCNFIGSNHAMHFHHLIASQKKKTISSITNRNDFFEEIKKCILVCSNCHMEIHDGLHPKILKVSLKNNSSTKTRRARMMEYIHYLGGSCKKCGYSKCFRALSFHHNKKDKEKSIGSLTFLPSLKIMKTELDKCELLCGNCHSKEHW